MSRTEFPGQGKSWEKIKTEIETVRAHDRPWYDQRMFIGGSYFGGEDVVAVANQAYQKFINYNALYAGKTFPSLLQFEAELVDALLELMNAPAKATGSITTGGTESLLLSVKTACAWARDQHPQIKVPEIIVPHAAHPGFDKAAHLFGCKAVRLSDSVNFRADVAGMAQAINENTAMLIGSAPSYPFGITDPIKELGILAKQHKLWLHVDACHGGFVLPFARLLAGIRSIDGLQVRGDPDAYLVAFGSEDCDIYALADAMAERGWLAERLTRPPSIHLFLDRSHEASVDAYLADLAQTSAAVKAGKIQSRNNKAIYAR